MKENLMHYFHFVFCFTIRLLLFPKLSIFKDKDFCLENISNVLKQKVTLGLSFNQKDLTCCVDVIKGRSLFENLIKLSNRFKLHCQDLVLKPDWTLLDDTKYLSEMRFKQKFDLKIFYLKGNLRRRSMQPCNRFYTVQGKSSQFLFLTLRQLELSQKILTWQTAWG